MSSRGSPGAPPGLWQSSPKALREIPWSSHRNLSPSCPEALAGLAQSSFPQIPRFPEVFTKISIVSPKSRDFSRFYPKPQYFLQNGDIFATAHILSWQSRLVGGSLCKLGTQRRFGAKSTQIPGFWAKSWESFGKAWGESGRAR